MKKTKLHLEKSGYLILGEITSFSSTLLKVKILYPYYGITLSAKPKMCMLFSDQSAKKLGEKTLEKAYDLGKMIEKRNKDIYQDFKKLYSLNAKNEEKRKKLLQEFRLFYLNGFKAIPELIINPLKDLYIYLEKFLLKNPDISTIHPETSFYFSDAEINKMIKEFTLK